MNKLITNRIIIHHTINIYDIHSSEKSENEHRNTLLSHLDSKSVYLRSKVSGIDVYEKAFSASLFTLLIVCLCWLECRVNEKLHHAVGEC